MTPSEALAHAQECASSWRVEFTRHALVRMRQRGVSTPDVLKALRTATTASWQLKEETWKFTGGVDVDGDDLTVCAVFDPDTTVITVY